MANSQLKMSFYGNLGGELKVIQEVMLVHPRKERLPPDAQKCLLLNS